MFADNPTVLQTLLSDFQNFLCVQTLNSQFPHLEMNIFLSRYEEILRFSLLFYYPERRFIYAPASVTHLPSVWVGGKHLNSFEIHLWL